MDSKRRLIFTKTFFLNIEMRSKNSNEREFFRELLFWFFPFYKVGLLSFGDGKEIFFFFFFLYEFIYDGEKVTELYGPFGFKVF